MGFAVSYLKWFSDLPAARHGQLLGSGLIAMLAGGALAGTMLALALTWSSSNGMLQLAHRSVAWTAVPLVMAEAVQTLLLSDLRARRAPLRFCAAAALYVPLYVHVGIGKCWQDAGR